MAWNYLQFDTQYSGDSDIVSEIFQPVSWEKTEKTSDILWRCLYCQYETIS